jgi:hypothetical protein
MKGVEGAFGDSLADEQDEIPKPIHECVFILIVLHKEITWREEMRPVLSFSRMVD